MAIISVMFADINKAQEDVEILPASVLSVCLIRTSLRVGEEFLTSRGSLPGKERKREEKEY